MQEKKIVYNSDYLKKFGDTLHSRKYVRDRDCASVLQDAQGEVEDALLLTVTFGGFGAVTNGLLFGAATKWTCLGMGFDDFSSTIVGVSFGAAVMAGIAAIPASKLLSKVKDLKGWKRVVDIEKNKPLRELEMGA